MAFLATLKNLHPQPLSTTLIALLLPLIGVCAVFNHRVAFVVVVVVANVEVLLISNVTWLLASLAQSSSSSSSELCDCRWWAPSSSDDESQDKEYDPSSLSLL
jgi:hypothetical protein